MLRTLKISALLLGTLVFPSLAMAELGCSDAVIEAGGTIEVAAVSGGDSGNLQCALDAATSGGYGTVLLTSPEYSLDGGIKVDDFSGALRGRSIANTRLVVQDGALSCVPGDNTVLSFSNGFGVLISFMSIDVGSPCASGNTVAIVAFTTDPDNCAQRTTFGTVDRVAFRGEGAASSGPVFAVAMEKAQNCGPQILGTLKVNRASFENLHYGVAASVGGGGQVDINFNEFTGMGFAIGIINAAQSTTILNNTINYNDATGYNTPSSPGLGTVGVFLDSNAASPASNSTTIKDNTFTDGGVLSSGIAITSDPSDIPVAHAINITGNRFVGTEGAVSGAGIAVFDTDNGVISGNRFVSGAGAWILLSGDDVRPEISGWAIVSNNFSESTTDLDIALRNSSGSIVGPDQNLPTVSDDTGNNTILQ
ncbi:MAG: hypothetical protein ACI87W_003113 [Halieaceae bacterium]|jgi:hypothetical protein